MNDILEVAADLSISHLHGSNGVTEKIKKAMYESAKQFVYIGFLLKEVRDYKYYEEGGYEDVYAYAEFELGFKRSSTKNFIAIAENFGIQEWKYEGITRKSQSMSLQPEYEKFNYSQLVELLAMSPAQRQAAKPEMTIRDLRSMKQKEREEAIRNTPPPASMLQQAPGQTSGQTDNWINVKDGLPENNKRVLVNCETKKGVQSINIAYYDGNNWHGNGSMSGVTHWMELPTHPRLKRSQDHSITVLVNHHKTELTPYMIRKLLQAAEVQYFPNREIKIDIYYDKC